MSTKQSRLATGQTPKPHLLLESGNAGSDLTADGEREFWCGDCGRRVTISTDHSREYGHNVDCQHCCKQGAL